MSRNIPEDKKKLQYLKYGVFLFISLTIVIRIATYIIYLNYSSDTICNYGISFGIILPTFLFWITWIIIMSFVLYLIIKNIKNSLKLTIAYTLILTGGLNNIIDRLIYGCVIDYIRIVPWNVFNLADTLIFIGAVIVLYSNFSKK